MAFGQNPLNLPVGSQLATTTIATAGQVSTGPGVLTGLSILTPGTTWAITLYDGTSTSGNELYTLTVTADGPISIPPTRFVTGLYIGMSGTAGTMKVVGFNV
jgi:hypothetical protein